AVTGPWAQTSCITSRSRSPSSGRLSSMVLPCDVWLSVMLQSVAYVRLPRNDNCAGNGHYARAHQARLRPSQMPTKSLITYANVAKRFDGGRVVAVDNVSLTVAEGEFLAIVGGSGSGKTTLLRLANRLIEADGGTITVEGEDVRAADPILLRRRIG